jgi:hypothetical protein
VFGIGWTKPAKTNQAPIFTWNLLLIKGSNTWNDVVKKLMIWTPNVNTHVSAYRKLDGRILENIHVELDYVLDKVMERNMILNIFSSTS